MPPFPKPQGAFRYDLHEEIAQLRRHRRVRGIPARRRDTMLLLTWNIANLGQHQRTDDDLTLIAEVMRGFDVIAVQECKEDCRHLLALQHRLGDSYHLLCSDAAGNDERMAFLFDRRKVHPLEEVGEIAFAVADQERIRLPGRSVAFNGFDRTPYLASFRVGDASVVLVNVHLFFGSERPADVERRSLETLAVATWADRRRRSTFALARDVIAMGDFNMPRACQGDAVFDALTRLGLVVPGHSSQVGSSIMSDAHYDQVAFLPGETLSRFTGKMGVFDFDQVVFRELYARDGKAFKEYCRYYLSDHRPMWVEVKI